MMAIVLGDNNHAGNIGLSMPDLNGAVFLLQKAWLQKVQMRLNYKEIAL